MVKRIYLDNNASTPLDKRVLQAMLMDLSELPGNPSSVHWFGRRAKNLLTQARVDVASFFNVLAEEIIFTSGATESLNLLLRSLGNDGHILTTNIEHSAVFNTIQELEKSGLRVSYIPVDEWGAPKPEEIRNAIRPETKAMVFSAVNAETGAKLDLKMVNEIALEKGIPVLLDAVAIIGKEPFQIFPSIKALAISAHKFHGPKGVGALYLSKSLKLKSTTTGGAQEQNRRGGTENLAGILGMAKALKIVKENQDQISQHLISLKTKLFQGLKEIFPNCVVNGIGPAVSNTLNIAFPGINGEVLLMHLDIEGVAVSHGSACSSGSLEPSRVLINMGIDRRRARSSIRLSLSRMNTSDEMEIAIKKFSSVLKKLQHIYV